MNILEAHLLHHLLPQVRAVDRFSKFAATLEDLLGPALKRRGLVGCAIIGHEAATLGLQLKVSPWSQAVEGFLEQLLGIGDTPFKFACVDEVEWFLVDPIILEVVDFEDAVWRSPASHLLIVLIYGVVWRASVPVGLNGTEICPDNFCRRVFTKAQLLTIARNDALTRQAHSAKSIAQIPVPVPKSSTR